MHRFVPYTILFIAVALLQALFFNNLSVSIYLTPMVYVAFIVLLPIQTSHFMVLMAGLAMGVVMDMSMGCSGVNTISTLFIAFARPYIINSMFKKDVVAGGGIPSDVLLGEGGYARYLIALVAIHHLIFFAFESLSMENINLYLLRFIFSGSVSVLSIWLLSRVFFAALVSSRR